MREETQKFAGRGPGIEYSLTRLTFGKHGARPNVYIQGGLHADEGPGMLTARMLADLLVREEAEGRLRGHVTVVPAANPIGLGQFFHSDQAGRFDLYDGRNFNRDYPDLSEMAAASLKGSLGSDPDDNVRLVRKALVDALDAQDPRGPADVLRHALLRAALEADVVLDLHCDGEAEVHLYTQPTSLDVLRPLASLTGCRALLVAEISGGNPFDEAVIRPWLDLAQRFPEYPIPPGCVSATLELRGRSDVSRALAAQDAAALLSYLRHLGVLDGEVSVPEPACMATPLAGSDALIATVAGLLSYTIPLGQAVETGDVVAEITDPLTGGVHPIHARTSGVFYARPATRIAEVGKRLGKIAGAHSFRDGPLLSP